MRVLVTGGGTGGHIYPALSIAKKVKSKYKNAEILYVGTENSMESELIPKEGFDFKSIRVKGFTRKLSLDTLKSVKVLFLGMSDARRVVKDFKPDIVIGTGGYVCGPIVLNASLMKIPTLIHEQNALPGVTNKILSRFVDKIAGSFEESKKHFKNPKKVIITGNPIRQDILSVDKDSAYKTLGINNNKPFILSFGGSGGQKKLNDAMMKVIKNNISNNNIQILHVTGKRFYKGFVDDLEKVGVNLKSINHIKVVPYLFEMPKALALADLIIGSAGAITIAEITAIGIPSILIPKAYTTENHQEFNARALESKGASTVILEKDLNGDILYNSITEILQNDNRLLEMSRNSKKLGIVDADERIFEVIEKLVKH